MILLRLAIRTMLRNKWAYLSCIILIIAGVVTYSVMGSGINEIDVAANSYYKEKNLADAFATVTRIPSSAIARLEKIDGIMRVEGRIVYTARLTDYDDKRLKLVSYRQDDIINRMELVEGEMSLPESIILSYSFYKENGYKLLDELNLTINGTKKSFTVSGYAYSPEYVYMQEDPLVMFIDQSNYSFSFVSEDYLAKSLSFEGNYNDISFLFEKGVEFEDVEDDIRAQLESYGLISLTKKEDMMSYTMTQQEIDEGQTMSKVIPIILMTISSLVLYMMMLRLINQQRTSIGLLKAFGYDKKVILMHYVSYGLIISVLGSFFGIVISLLLIKPYIAFYLDFYSLPIEPYITDYSYFYLGVIMAVVMSAIAAFIAARKIVMLSPADSMKPEAPKPFTGVKISSSIRGLLNYLFNMKGFIAYRNIFRAKKRSLFIVAGIMLSYGLLAFAFVSSQIFDDMFYNRFNYCLDYDGEVIFDKPVYAKTAVSSFAKIDENIYAEGFYETFATYKKGNRKNDSIIVAIDKDSLVYHVYDDTKNKKLKLKSGIILTNVLASKIGASKGDFITVNDERVIVDDVVNQIVGMGAYMDYDVFNRLYSAGGHINKIAFRGDIKKINDETKDSINVKKVISNSDINDYYLGLLDSFAFILALFKILGIVIGFVIIYNTGIISLSERSREYSTLRVIGLSVNEINEIIGYEYIILTLAGLILGVPFAMFLNNLVANLLDIESFTWPTNISYDILIYSVFGIVTMVAVSRLFTYLSLRKLNLIEVLKERE